MGILPGATVMVIQHNKGGPLLLKVKGSRVALGKKIAEMVKVGL
jgi:Fe2+ transport system protein FeoA